MRSLNSSALQFLLAVILPAITAAVAEHVSWGWSDYRRKGEASEARYQSPPVNWGISSDRKRAFFNSCAEITGADSH